MGFIYKWTCKINNKSYIGQTTDPDKRYISHIYSTSKDKFHEALKYYGLINFDYEIIEETDNLDEREVYWIKYYDSFNNGYNTKIGGNYKLLRERLKTPTACFGYIKDKHGKIQIYEEEANIIRDIFNEYVSGEYHNHKELSKKYGKQTYNIITNIKYTGDEHYPQIIDIETFNQANELLHNRHKSRKIIE